MPLSKIPMEFPWNTTEPQMLLRQEACSQDGEIGMLLRHVSTLAAGDQMVHVFSDKDQIWSSDQKCKNPPKKSNLLVASMEVLLLRGFRISYCE